MTGVVGSARGPPSASHPVGPHDSHGTRKAPDMHPHPTSALRRSRTGVALALGLAAALTLSMFATSDASSHREAPLIMEDPVADNTDVYAFVSHDRPDTTTLISNFVPVQEPGGGPNYFRFGEDVLYEIKVDSTGDAQPDVTYEFRFRNDIQDPNNYLYALGPISSLDDPNYNFRQTMTVFEVRDGERTQIAGDLTLPPANVGPRSTPDYEALAAQGVHDIGDGMRVFAGQRDDGFYADIASIFDLGGLRPFNEAHAIPLPAADGIDTLSGYNVHSIALQVPTARLLASSEQPIIGVWSTASRRRVQTYVRSSGAQPISRGRWVQVSRLGNPLVNEVVVPLGVKDTFNALKPAQDADVFPNVDAPPLSTEGPIPLVTDPILGAQIEALYGLELPPAPRNDLVSVFLTGVEGLNQPPDVRPAEVLRLNTSIAPTAEPNRLGVLAGDNAGFPNGRRVGDDVVDISLRAVAGVLVDGFNRSPNNELTDGVMSNDVPYLGTFPYLGTPHQGYDLNNPARVTP
jgi:hypothetical protein